MNPHEVLKHHVTGAIERGEATPIVEQTAPKSSKLDYKTLKRRKRGRVGMKLMQDAATYLCGRYCHIDRAAGYTYGFPNKFTWETEECRLAAILCGDLSREVEYEEAYARTA